jgi:hypothetical protein
MMVSVNQMAKKEEKEEKKGNPFFTTIFVQPDLFSIFLHFFPFFFKSFTQYLTVPTRSVRRPVVW